MKRKKRVTLITVLVLVMVMLLAACGGKTEKATDTKVDVTPTVVAKDNTETVEVVDAVVPLEPVELTWYYFGDSPGKDAELVEAKMGEYLKDKINATIKLYPMGWDEFGTKTKAMAAANEPMDIVFSAQWIGFSEGIASNRWLDITDLFGQYCPKTKALMGEEWIAGGTVNDRFYAVSTMKEIGHAYGFMVNKELLEKYNLSLDNVKSLEDMRPLLEVIKANEPDVVPFDTSVLGVDVLLPQESISGDILPLVTEPSSDKVILSSELPGYSDLLNTVHDFFLKGYIPSDVSTAKESMQGKRDNGLVFAFVSQLNPASAASNSNDKVTWETVYITPITISNNDIGGSMNSISATSKNPERALMFLELLNTDVYLNNLLAFGIEGKHYNMVSENTIEKIPDSGYSHGNQWVFANQFLNYYTTNDDPNKWEIIAEFNEKATPERSLGFKYDLEPWVEAVGAIKLIQSEYYDGVGLQEPVSALESRLERLNEAGINDLKEDLNAKYNEWLKK